MSRKACLFGACICTAAILAFILLAESTPNWKAAALCYALAGATGLALTFLIARV